MARSAGTNSPYFNPFWPAVQAYLKDIAGSVPNHHNKMNIAIKQILIFLLMKALAFNL